MMVFQSSIVNRQSSIAIVLPLVLCQLCFPLHAGIQEVVPSKKIADNEECASAEEAFRARQYDRAANLALQCIEQGKGSSEIYKLLALSSFMLNRSDDYQKNMEKAIALNPGDGGAQYHLGRFFYEKKQLGDALERFRKAVALDPENYKGYYFAALCLQQSGDPKGATENYRKAIEIIERQRANYGWPYVDLGELLIQDSFEEGLSWIYRGTRNQPALPYAHYAYARALMRQEASFEVEQALQRAVKLDPGYAEAYYLLARYYTKIGDTERAKNTFAKFEALRKNPLPSPFGLRR